MAVPLTPVNLTLSEIRSTSVKASAQQGQSGLTARRFYIVRSNNTGPQYFDATFAQGGIFSAILTGLTPDDQYAVAAYVINADGTSNWTPYEYFTTYITYSAPPNQAASDIHVGTITSSSIAVSQAASNLYGRPPDLEYQLAIRESAGTTWTYSNIYTNPAAVLTFSGLDRATQHLIRGRVRNEVGWSDWSGDTYATTLATVPDVPPTPTLSGATQNTVAVAFADPNNGGSAILERQIYWGSTSTPTGNATASDGSTTVTVSPAGSVVYFRVRVRNAIGWSSYSAASSVKLIAGAWVKYNNTWKEAVPWVKVSGVWKVAKPWVRIMGVWKGVK